MGGSFGNTLLTVFTLGLNRLLGIYTHNETFTDLQISNLITPEAAEDVARRQAKRMSMGSMEKYFTAFRGFQRDYRKKYGTKFMTNLGYAPSSTASTRTVIDSKVELYLETLYSYVDVNIVEAKDDYLSTTEKGGHAIRTLAGYDYPTGYVYDTGKTYILTQYVEPQDDRIEVNMKREYEEDILANLTNNYTYDGTYATILGKEYVVGAISSLLNGSDQYETECTRSYADITASGYVTLGDLSTPAVTITYPQDVNADGDVTLDEISGSTVTLHIELPVGAAVDDIMTITIDGVPTDYTVTQVMIDNGYDILHTGWSTTVLTETIFTQADRKVYTVINADYASEASFARYSVTSGEVGTEVRYWVDAANTQDIYDRVNVPVTTIVTMKEDNAMVDLEGRQLNRMLRRLNLSGEQLQTSIENPDIDSAYVMTGINPQYDDDVTNKTLFKMFDLMSAGDGNVSIAIDKLDMQYNFGIAKQTVAGSIGPAGTITRVNTGTLETSGMVLTLQVDSNEYKIVTVTNFSMRYNISGHAFTAYLDSTSGLCRLVIPVGVMNSLRYKDFVWIYERSLCMLAYALQVVEVKWYETAAFGTLLKIAAVVITVWSLGAGSGAAGGLYAMAGKLAVAAAIMFVAQQIALAIGGTFGAIVGAAVAIYAMMQFGGMDFGSTDMWLMTANQAIGVVNQHLAHKAAELQLEMSQFYDEMEKKVKELEEAQEELGINKSFDYVDMFDSGAVGRPNEIYQTTEQYCAQLVDNTDMTYLVDYGQQIANQLGIRQTVYVG